MDLSQWDKLIANILKLDRSLRFDDLAKALRKIGYKKDQPRGGSSHYTFRKTGHLPITIPKAQPINKAYIELVRNAIVEYESEKEAQKGEG